MAARQFRLAAALDHFPSAFAGFALLLAPYWFFGFGAAKWLRARLRTRWIRVTLPGTLVLPYIVFTLPRGQISPTYTLIFLLTPIALAALFELAPASGGLGWQDVLVLAAVGIPVEFGTLRGAWPLHGLGAMPKLLLMDAALYAFLVIRGTPDAGYDFRPRWRDLVIGMREWALFAPVAIGLGLALHFIRFRPYAPYGWQLAAGWLVTFFFVAIPEELFFRGLLQNLLEKRLDSGSGNARLKALLIAAPIFGLSHFNKPLPFNWRYVLLATIAGVFYGRAWRDRRRLFASGITHATVDVVWSVWFR
jgi:membrane protease YdiL (CAAX protease family)